jgi:hypothetical protein
VDAVEPIKCPVGRPRKRPTAVCDDIDPFHIVVHIPSWTYVEAVMRSRRVRLNFTAGCFEKLV